MSLHWNSSYVFLMITGSLRQRPQVRCHCYYPVKKSANCQQHLALARHFDYPAEDVSARVTVKLLFLLPFHKELFGRSHSAWSTLRRGQFSSSPLRRKHLHEPFEILLQGTSVPSPPFISNSMNQCIFCTSGTKTTQLYFIVPIIMLLSLIVRISFGQ